MKHKGHKLKRVISLSLLPNLESSRSYKDEHHHKESKYKIKADMIRYAQTFVSEKEILDITIESKFRLALFIFY